MKLLSLCKAKVKLNNTDLRRAIFEEAKFRPQMPQIRRPVCAFLTIMAPFKSRGYRGLCLSVVR
jgi:hypothetical protein